eukprot:scaffold11473_cov80-Isochrysis_galbana.AAC.1
MSGSPPVSSPRRAPWRYAAPDPPPRYRVPGSPPRHAAPGRARGLAPPPPPNRCARPARCISGRPGAPPRNRTWGPGPHMCADLGATFGSRSTLRRRPVGGRRGVGRAAGRPTAAAALPRPPLLPRRPPALAATDGLALVVEDAHAGAAGDKKLDHVVAAARGGVEDGRLAVRVQACQPGEVRGCGLGRPERADGGWPAGLAGSPGVLRARQGSLTRAPRINVAPQVEQPLHVAHGAAPARVVQRRPAALIAIGVHEGRVELQPVEELGERGPVGRAGRTAQRRHRCVGDGRHARGQRHQHGQSGSRAESGSWAALLRAQRAARPFLDARRGCEPCWAADRAAAGARA